MQLHSLIPLEKYGLKHIQGSLELQVAQVLPPDQCKPDSLVFVSKPELAALAISKGAKALIKTQSLDFSFPEEICLFEVPSVSAGLAMILPLFDKKALRFEHSSQHFVHPTAQVGADVTIGYGSSIGAGTIIGKGTKIGSQVTIENDCIIGDNCIFHPQVFVGAQTEIGKFCEIHPHTTLGSDGFGYVLDPATGISHKIPQLGKVVLEDNVEIGSNCAIDRATLTETRIRRGTKFDNLIHIAHNCDVGENSLITAGFGTAGSTKFGNRFTTGGQCATAGHLNIADNVTLAGRSVVISDIKEPGTYGGFPAVKIHQHLKTQRALLDLPEIWKFWRKETKEKI
jgi:UDP-3-O-[3-hydroxymyristoyl] glucosamine N-acyltransferase